MALIRLMLGKLILLLNWPVTPRGMTRDPQAQSVIDQQTTNLKLYQYDACPFCVKVRRAMKRQSLTIEPRDVKRCDTAREELLPDRVPNRRDSRMKYVLKWLVIILFSAAILGCSSVQTESTDSTVGYTETGIASFYGDKHQFKKTASGELYNHDLKTAAHRNISFGSKLKVTNVDNNKSVVVKVNDRGPFVRGRIVDLSKSAFSSIGDTSSGLIRVQIEVIE